MHNIKVFIFFNCTVKFYYFKKCLLLKINNKAPRRTPRLYLKFKKNFFYYGNAACNDGDGSVSF